MGELIEWCYFFKFIYLAASGLSHGRQALCCLTGDLSLRCRDCPDVASGLSNWGAWA